MTAPLNPCTLALALAAILLTGPVSAQITFYEHDDFRGRVFSTSQPVRNFNSVGFNDRASSVVVQGGRWEVCENAGFAGPCVVLRPGSYASLRGMGLNDQLSSTRRVDLRAQGGDGPVPMEAPPYAYRRRPNERLFEAPVSSVRAVVGAPTERCWIERHQATQAERGDPNVGRGLLGAVLGGVIGHQIGGGSGRDLATAGGVVAGAMIGANSGRDQGGTPARDVRRCNSVASTVPAYWDVDYRFRGVNHHIQMSTEPGETITVNRNGDPRG